MYIAKRTKQGHRHEHLLLLLLYALPLGCLSVWLYACKAQRMTLKKQSNFACAHRLLWCFCVVRVCLRTFVRMNYTDCLFFKVVDEIMAAFVC